VCAVYLDRFLRDLLSTVIIIGMYQLLPLKSILSNMLSKVGTLCGLVSFFLGPPDTTTMEDEVVSSPCPVCGREVIGSFATHLQLHTKQDLILTIISQHDALGLFLRQPKSPSSDQSEERGRRSTSPPKKAGSRTGRRKSSGSSLAPARDQRGREVTGHPPLTSTSEPTAQHQSGSQPLMLELEIGQYGNTEPETTEIMPIQICSYISDPGTEDTPNEPNPQLQTLYPMDSQDRHATSHSNFIQYIIETVSLESG